MTLNLNSMSVLELRRKLIERGLDTKGLKRHLIERLQKALDEENLKIEESKKNAEKHQSDLQLNELKHSQETLTKSDEKICTIEKPSVPQPLKPLNNEENTRSNAINLARRSGKAADAKIVWIGNLNPEMTVDQLLSTFSSCGKIISGKIYKLKQHFSNFQKFHFACLQMSLAVEAALCVDRYDNQQVQGNQLSVQCSLEMVHFKLSSQLNLKLETLTLNDLQLIADNSFVGDENTLNVEDVKPIISPQSNIENLPIKKINELKTETILIKQEKEIEPKETKTLLISNIGTKITAADLKKYFSQYGNVCSVHILSKGKDYPLVGYLQMSTAMEASFGIQKCNGVLFKNKILTVEATEPIHINVNSSQKNNSTSNVIVKKEFEIQKKEDNQNDEESSKVLQLQEKKMNYLISELERHEQSNLDKERILSRIKKNFRHSLPYSKRKSDSSHRSPSPKAKRVSSSSRTSQHYRRHVSPVSSTVSSCRSSTAYSKQNSFSMNSSSNSTKYYYDDKIPYRPHPTSSSQYSSSAYYFHPQYNNEGSHFYGNNVGYIHDRECYNKQYDRVNREDNRLRDVRPPAQYQESHHDYYNRNQSLFYYSRP